MLHLYYFNRRYNKENKRLITSKLQKRDLRMKSARIPEGEQNDHKLTSTKNYPYV